MKRIVRLLLFAALIGILMAGCGREEEKPETQPPTQEPTQGVQQVELELPRDERPYLDVQLQFASLLEEGEPRAQVLKQAAEVFSARTGAQVDFLWLAGDERLLETTLAENEDVDIFSVSVDELRKTYRFSTMDLTEMAAAYGYEEHSHAALRNQIVERMGCLAAIAQEPLLYGMYYNASTLDSVSVTEYPDSWEDFLTFSAYLTDKGIMPLTIDYENANLILELFLERQLGREQLESMMSKALWTREVASIELFRMPIDYAGAGYLAKGDPTAFPGGQDKLALSNVAMVAGSNLLCRQVEESAMMDVTWGVFPFPGDGEGKGFAAESQVLAIPRESPDGQAAFEFIMLLTTGSFDQLYADVSGGIPADPANASTIRGAKELMAQAGSEGFGLLRTEHNELFSRLWNGYYKTPSYFASSMNNLAWEYQPEPTEGVG